MKRIDETIPGGRYRGADGSWHDANGKPLPPPEPEPVEAEPEQPVAVEATQPEPEQSFELVDQSPKANLLEGATPDMSRDELKAVIGANLDKALAEKKGKKK